MEQLIKDSTYYSTNNNFNFLTYVLSKKKNTFPNLKKKEKKTQYYVPHHKLNQAS